MENKYYTPTLDEFCVGFEFEHFNFEGKLISHPSNKAEWHKEICDSDWFNTIFDDYEHSQEEIDKYKVKYLDSEDIESLGFFYYKKGWGEGSLIFRSNRGEGLELYFRKDYLLHISKANGMVFFEGFINNKSEFKKLLKQLRIIEDGSV